MKVHSYIPHVAGDVTGIDFCYFLNADAITDPSMIATSNLVSGGKNFPVTVDNITDGKLLKYKWYTKTPRSGYANLSKLGSDWNAIALYKGSTSDKTYLSLIYWDSPISKVPLFETLTLSYTATSEVKAEGGDIDIDFDYTQHVTEDARNLGETLESTDLYHPHLNGKLRKSLSEDVSSNQTYNISSIPFKLNGIISTSQEVTLENWGTDAPLSDKLIPLCVPNVTTGELGVSSDLGCYIYQVGSSSTSITFPNGHLNAPLGTSDAFKTANQISAPKLPSNSELYILGREVLVAYCPETYEVYCSCLKYDNSKGYYFENFWKVGEGEKIIIPSYFNVFPFALFQDKQGEWKVVNYKAFASTLPPSGVEYQMELTGSKWDEVVGETCRTIQNFTRSTSSDDYIRVCMFDELNGCTLAQRNRIIDYIKNQFYISYTTFIQCLRYFPEYNIQIGDCGCVCRNGSKVLFVPYSPLIEKNSSRKMATVRRLPDNSKVDNFLYYVGGTIGSILTGETKSVSGRVSLRNGVLAQFTS